MSAPHGWMLLGLLTLSACASGSGAGWSRPGLPPAASTSAGLLALETLDTGLRVARVAPRGEVFEAAVMVAAGPLDDPADRPGLTHWLVQASLLGSEGDADAYDTPHRRALELGGTLMPIVDGAVAGWAVMGPHDVADELLALLTDVALRPSLPPTRLELSARQTREHLEEQDEDGIEAAVALAAGMALGLARPLPLGPPPELFDDLNREDIRRHWLRLVRPERAALVLPAGAPLPDRLATWRSPEGEALPTVSPCEPQGQAAHLVLRPRAPRGRGIVLVALAGPRAGGGAGRAAAMTLLELLSARTGGPLGAALPPPQARRARPRLLDVGGAPGQGASVIILGLAGEHAPLIEHLNALTEALRQTGVAGGLDREGVRGAARRAVSRRLSDASLPLARMSQAGVAALHGAPQAPIEDLEVVTAQAHKLWAPWRWAVVAVGRRDLGVALQEVAPVHTWDNGRKVAGPELPRCLSAGPDGALRHH